MFVKIVLPPDEDIVRLFARSPSAMKKSISVRPLDFDRRMSQMSGISMFRARSKERARENWSSDWPKGILIAKAGAVQSLGLDFYDTGNDHFSVRCSGCDLSENQFAQRPLCTKVDGSICDFDPAVVTTGAPNETLPLSIRNRLMQIFMIDMMPH